MIKKIKEIAELLLYYGPDIEQLKDKAISEGKDYSVVNADGLKTLKIDSVLPYNLNVTDIYVYNSEKQLIKQVLVIGDKKEIVFDKYKEAEKLIQDLSEIYALKISA